MQCLVTTQRSKPRGKSGLRAGMPIANIISSINEYRQIESASSNATLSHKIEHTNVKSDGSNIRAFVSVVANIGFESQQQNVFSEGLFGAPQTSTRLSEKLNLKCESKLNVNNILLGWIVNPDSNTPTFVIRNQNVTNVPSDPHIEQQQISPSVTFKFYSKNERNTGFDNGVLNNQKNGNVRAFAAGGLINVFARLSSKTRLINTYTDKLSGHFEQINKLNNFTATQKLYPIRDVETSKNAVSFVDKYLSATGLFQSVDEGLFIGNYTQHGKVSSRVSDDYGSFIHPSSIYSQGDFRYKCEVTAPRIKPIENFLFIRAAAPMSVLESDIPPQYKIYNIRFEDPSGNLITQYKDISIRGDSDFSKENESYNFATYVTEPLYNNAKRYNWEENSPIFGEASGYTLSMDFKAICFYRPFSPNFNFGYEDGCRLEFIEDGDNNYLALDGSPLSTQSQGFDFTPNNSIRISNIEIVASGSVYGMLCENYTNLYAKARDKGLLAERNIYPSQVVRSDFDTGVNPQVNTVWKTYDIESNTYYNDNSLDLPQLNNVLNDLSRTRFIELHSIDGVSDSGKLILKYEHKPPVRVKEQTGGSFSFGSKSRDSRLQTAKLEYVYGPDVFFEIDSIELHITARKAEGSRDYALDVVGYCDDKILNVTPPVAGFLQNAVSGVGSTPISSGFLTSDYLTSSAETISSREEYFYNDVYPNEGGDHYLLTQSPIVNTTEFTDYVIPLRIYKKNNKLGLPEDYTSSSNFEALYLDIYPLPSGAAISKADLVVKYKPSNAMTLHTLGMGDVEVSRRYAGLFVNDDKNFNARISDKPLSLIENIPHAYETPDTFRSNYARRWRGVDGGAKAGPFITTQFDFSFYNPPLEKPFNKGYYDFNSVDGNNIYSTLENNTTHNTGVFNGLLSENIIKNIGLRFNSEKLFPSQDIPYKTLDWTSANDELHGQIMDSFDNVVRVNQSNLNINFGQIDLNEGFSLFTRFSPDYNVSGINYNLFNSGVIISKWDEEKDLELTLGYEDGYLTAIARDENNQIIKTSDTVLYSEYQYPLAVLLTYNDNDSRRLKLYTDNEISSGNWSLLRSTSPTFTMDSGNSNLVVGHSYGSGVGFNGFIAEVGLSEANIVQSDIDFGKQHIDVERFFDSFRSDFLYDFENDSANRTNISSFVDEDTSKWYIGAFKYCEFGIGLDRLKKRIGEDYITHSFYTDGFTYQNNCDLPLPSNQFVLNGLAYHTQLENDMLRISLDDINDKFIAAAPRVVKTFPRGYDFATDAIAVDTIVEYSSDQNIIWPDGHVGPKLIVSLYTQSRETDLFETKNWGLINRDTHYLDPKLCWQKLNSRFTVNSVQDKESEPWGNFIRDEIINETNHYRYSNDINKMFLQYDLAYPSGSYNAQINIHSSHVRLEDALHLSDVMYVDDFALFASGESIVRESLPLSFPDAFNYANSAANYPSGLTLYASGGQLTNITSRMNLFSSGAFLLSNENSPLTIYTHNFATKSIGPDEFNLRTIGGFDFGGSFSSFGSYISDDQVDSEELFGVLEANRGIRQAGLVLHLANDERFNGPYAENSFALYTELGGTLNENSVNLYVKANYETAGTTGFAVGVRKRKGSLSLVVQSEIPDNIEEESAILFVDGYDPQIETVSGSLSLHTVNINPLNKSAGQLETFNWNGTNKGTSIKLVDNYLLSIDVDDEIRGVVTMCYGDCDENGNCLEYQIITHDTLWFDTQCVDGGVIRPINIYNNPNTIGFNVIQTGYDRNYYGARKFENLVPGSPYKIIISAQTGTSGILEVPKEITEWEYGTNEDVDYSGVKTLPPANHRNPGDHFGYSAEISDNLLAIGAPYYDLEENGYPLYKAGSIFLYRRDPEPSGYDWSGQPDKSPWKFETQLTLPHGFLRDYYEDKPITIGANTGGTVVNTTVRQRQYYVGQNGRELGYSLDLAKTETREIIVAGGPGAAWSREFEEIEQEPVNVAIFIFTDEFLPCYPWPRVLPSLDRPGSVDYRAILPSIIGKDLLYKYFCDPPLKFNFRIIICQGVLGLENTDTLDFSDDRYIPVPDFAFTRKIHRVKSFANLQEKTEQENVIIQELKDIYHEFFPLDETKLNNNIPSILGFYVDNSLSYGTRALGSLSETAIDGGALGKFIDWVKEYSYENGLIDRDNNPAYPYIRTEVESDEGWINQSISIIDFALDIDKLIESRAFDLFINSFGFNDNVNEFNLPAPSGGSVYIFEKMDYGWEVIQEIKSPTTSNDTHVDRFGHDVAISDDGNIIVIGSPYIDSAVQIYEYNKNYMSTFYDRFAAWIVQNGDPSVDTTYGELYEARRTFNQLVSQNIGRQAFLEASQTVFEDLSPSGKFAFRKDYYQTVDNWGNRRINQSTVPYKLIREIRHSQIKPSHAWPWLMDQYIPTARLGYSVDVNEDGSTVVIGSPTDSFGAQDESIAWYKPGYKRNSEYNWASNINAGAVRILEGRNYYPHRSVVQYGPFGNLHRTLNMNEDNSSLFNHFDAFYASSTNSVGEKISYYETEFIDPEIPEDAGTLFIITPEEDALSQEIIDNIRNWLSLGDRNLVLVGNDPIWEDNGAYAESNAIINSLLRSLGSRMKLHPARNRYESLVDRDSGLYYNNLPVTPPAKTTSHNTYTGRMTGSGVADIRLEDENIYRMYSCQPVKEDSILAGIAGLPQTRKKQYVELHNRCNMPIIHEGDLRSEWTDQCSVRGGFIDYKVNLAFVYGTHTTSDWGCESLSDTPIPESLTKNYEPIPLLAAAEATQVEQIIPTIPDRTVTQKVLERTRISGFKKTYADVADSGVAFIWSANSGNYTYLNLNETSVNSNSTFFDPLEYNSKNAILQAKSEILNEPVEYKEIKYPYFTSIAEERYQNLSSKVILISTVLTESASFLYAGSDENIKMYMNLTDKDSVNQSKIAQLGGWTNRSSFRAGYSESELASVLDKLGNNVEENVDPSTINFPSKQYDIIWIANTDSLPSQLEIQQLKTWLSEGKDRKLIITFGTTSNGNVPRDPETYSPDQNLLDRTKVADYLCEQLGVSIKPMFLATENRYASWIDGLAGLSRFEREAFEIDKTNTPAIDPAFSQQQSFTNFYTNYDISYYALGYRGTRSNLSSISFFSESSAAYDIVPIDVGNNGRALLWSYNAIVGNTSRDGGVPFINSGFAKVTFPIKEKTSYRIFFTTVSETKQEKMPLGIFIDTLNEGAADYSDDHLYLDGTPITSDISFINSPFNANSFVENAETVSPLVGPYIGKQLKFFQDQSRGYPNAIYDRRQLGIWPITNFSGRQDTYYVDLTAPSGVDEFSVYISASFLGENVENPQSVFTQRLVSISGAEIDIIQDAVFENVYKNVEVIIPGRQEIVNIVDVERHISTDSSKYCPSTYCKELWSNPSPEIADGPVTVAEEIYFQRPFNDGVNRSRITLISDASLIQGDTILKEGSATQINENVLYLLLSLYPFTTFPQQNNGLQYLYLNKIVSPEKSSPAKLLVENNNPAFNNLFGGYDISKKNAIRFSNDENVVDFSTVDWRSPGEPYYHKGSDYVVPRDAPPPGPSAIELSRSGQVNTFQNLVESMGVHPKFKVTINGKTYEDNDYGQGVTELMKDYGYDYLDFENMHHITSGYPGDLFGYKVKIHKDKIYVSSPFSIFDGEEIIDWNDVIQNTPNGPIYNSKIGYYGGAGAVYVYEKNYLGVGVNNTQTSWSCTRKIKPDTLSVSEEASEVNDMFGKNFTLDGDVLVISAPGHSDDSLLVRTSGEFIRKEFGPQFRITGLDAYDLGNSNLPDNILNSGLFVKNQGAVFAYENKIADWGTKKQDWVLTQKLVPQGYNSRTSETEKEFFGKSLSIYRSRRNDSDYSLVVGSPRHQYGTSGNEPIVPTGGAAYLYDAMLRRQPPSYSHPETNIEGRIFGDIESVSEEEKYVHFDFKNGDNYDKIIYQEAVVFANQFGEIFIEASGQDKNERGYAVHRPYIKAIEGSFMHGKYLPEYTRLFTNGKPPESSASMPLFSPETTDNVYNTLGMLNNGILGYASGDILPLYAQGGYASTVSNSGLRLFLPSGIASGIDVLGMYVRGKFI